MTKFYFLVLLGLLTIGCRSSILDDPTTNIQFSVEQPSYVKLVVENSYDTIIATLVDGPKDAGIYVVSLDMNGLPEGIYFYTLECRGTTSTYYTKTTNRLILLK